MRRITFISLALLFLMSAAENSFACSCAPSIGPVKAQVKEAFKKSTAIFSGEVISIAPTSEHQVTVTMRVGKSWKGKLAKEITITTAANSAMCGYGFEAGKTYLVYAFGANDSLMTTICSRTKLSSNTQDITHLNKLKRQKVKYS